MQKQNNGFVTPNDVLQLRSRINETSLVRPDITLCVSPNNLDYLRHWSIGDVLFGVKLVSSEDPLTVKVLVYA